MQFRTEGFASETSFIYYDYFFIVTLSLFIFMSSWIKRSMCDAYGRPSWTVKTLINLLKPSDIYIYISIYIQGVPGGKDLTSGECSLRQTIPI